MKRLPNLLQVLSEDLDGHSEDVMGHIDLSDEQVWPVYPVTMMQFDPEIESFRQSTHNYFTDLLLENARPVPGYWSNFSG